MLTAIEGLLWMALVVFGEARSEPIEGQIAVAHVIINRAHSPKYPNTIEGVANQDKQFEPIKGTNLWRGVNRACKVNPDAFDKAITASVWSLSGVGNKGYTHFWSPYVRLRRGLKSRPYWAKGCDKEEMIGSQIFCRMK